MMRKMSERLQDSHSGLLVMLTVKVSQSPNMDFEFLASTNYPEAKCQRLESSGRPPIMQSLLHRVKADQVALGIED